MPQKVVRMRGPLFGKVNRVPRTLKRPKLVLGHYGWRGFAAEYRWPLVAAGLGLGLLVAIVAVVLLASSSGSSATHTPPPQSYAAPLGAVPTNRVTGNGSATIQLRGDTAAITLDTNGLLNGSPHLAHIHGMGLGACPTSSSARLHNGHLSISTGDAIRLYGSTLASFTLWGSTSGSVPNNIDMNRYPATGTIRYKRTITLTRLTADLIRDGDATIVVHGIDYNANRIYDFAALGVSDLDKTLPGEATAPALCGALRLGAGMQSASARGTRTFVASLNPYGAPATPSPGVASSGTRTQAVAGRSAAPAGSADPAFVCHLL
jgi:hypothetical protein